MTESSQSTRHRGTVSRNDSGIAKVINFSVNFAGRTKIYQYETYYNIYMHAFMRDFCHSADNL